MQLPMVERLYRASGAQVESSDPSAGRKWRRTLPPPRARLALIVAAFALLATPAHAKQGERKRSVAGSAVDAATQPLADLNIKSRKIPGLLLDAQAAPYDMTGLDGCAALHGEIGAYDDVLGPDADGEAESRGAMRGALATGGDLLGGFIPFRGVVRTLSGAKKKRAEMEEAIYAGVARRSYLKGFAAAKGCPTREQAALQAAADVLGMSGPLNTPDKR